MLMDFDSPILLKGDAHTAYRDPAVYFHEGVFYLYFTLVETDETGGVWLFLAMTTSRDLKHFTPVVKLSEKDKSKNFSSPGNVFRFNGRFCLCCQTYCRENGEKYANQNARIWLMRSDDLIHWDKPEWLNVKNTSFAEAGRMIDPYIIEDRNQPGLWWCFYKQNGVSISSSRDLVHWEYRGRANCGENVCVLYDEKETLYRLWHSPENGIGEKTSRDLIHWEDTGRLIILRQLEWPWAQGRLTAGMLLDLRNEPGIGKALIFFHGTGPQNEDIIFDQYACIAFAWSDDLRFWQAVL